MLYIFNNNLKNQFLFDKLGVTWSLEKSKWIAQISIDCKNKFLGYFENEIDAAKTRDIATKKYFGEFGKLNFQIN